MKSIFLTNDGKKIQEVYSGDITIRMKKLSLDSDIVYTEKDLGVIDFSEVEHIFSTWNMPILTEKQIVDYFPRLKAIFYAAGTVKYFAKPFLNRGIKIFNADQANGKAVADFVTGQILLATKGYYQAQCIYKHRNFSKARRIVADHTGNYEATVGIIGAGKIGRMVITNLSKFDLHIIACDPFLTEDSAKNLGCEKVDMKDIFQRSEVVSNHLPDIPTTAGILNYELFQNMKNNSTFINTGRGRQVVEGDLIRVLSNNKTICAVLDVTGREPLFPTNRMFLMPNVFLTPHIAGSTGNEQRRMGAYMIDAYEDFCLGRSSEYEVTIESIEKTT